MMKNRLKWLIVPGLMLGTAFALTAFGLRPADARSVAHTGAAARSLSSPAIVSPKKDNPIVLDTRHRFALGMIETANKDSEIGGAGEVSRYQIMPSVWKHYSSSEQYQNPDVSLAVAQQHWFTLHAAFIKQTHREPTDFDMYVLWNTGPTYYASKGFEPDRLNPLVRDRAQRFVNLVNRDEL